MCEDEPVAEFNNCKNHDQWTPTDWFVEIERIKKEMLEKGLVNSGELKRIGNALSKKCPDFAIAGNLVADNAIKAFDEVERLTKQRDDIEDHLSNMCKLCDKNFETDEECDDDNCQVAACWDIIEGDDASPPVDDMSLVAPISKERAEELVNDPVIVAGIKRIIAPHLFDFQSSADHGKTWTPAPIPSTVASARDAAPGDSDQRDVDGGNAGDPVKCGYAGCEDRDDDGRCHAPGVSKDPRSCVNYEEKRGGDE
jgi:hypothetical protein